MALPARLEALAIQPVRWIGLTDRSASLVYGITLFLLTACGAAQPPGELSAGAAASLESSGSSAAPGEGGTSSPDGARFDSPLALSNLAASLAAAGKPIEAEKTLQRALDLAPENPILLAELARLRLADGREAEAVQAAVRAADLDRGANGRIYLLAVSARLRAGQLHEAQDDLRRWHEAHGSTPLLRVAGGLVHEWSGRDREAEAEYEAALSADPSCAEALSGLIKLRFAHNDNAGALAALRGSSTGGVAPRIWEGQALRRLGRLEEAGAAFEAALAIEPEHPAALANLGSLRASQGDYAGARPLLARALELQPDLEAARASLAEVERRLSSRPDLAREEP